MLERVLNKLRPVRKQQAIVLMYHRIAKLSTDPWDLAVSPQNFEKQLATLLKLKYSVISVKELAEALEHKTIAPRTICLTFDDGYVDNLEQAMPILEKYDMPATFFICSKYMIPQEQFWWDSLQDIILNSLELPRLLSLEMNDDIFNFEIAENILTNVQVQKHNTWKWPADAPTERCKLYLLLWEKLRPLPLAEINKRLDALKKWAGYKKPTEHIGSPMSKEQLISTATNPLFNLGIHTSTHPALSLHTKDYQEIEITGCRYDLQSWFGKNIDTIAYPYGSFNDDTLAIVEGQHLRTCFTTKEKPVTNLSDRYQLGRFHVKNWNEKEFTTQLYNWNNYF